MKQSGDTYASVSIAASIFVVKTLSQSNNMAHYVERVSRNT
jgi:hypothetical protein